MTVKSARWLTGVAVITVGTVRHVAYSWHDAAKAIADHVGFTFDV